MVGTVFFYIGLALSLGLFIYLLVFNIRFVKNKIIQKDYKKQLIKSSYISIGFVVSFLIMMMSVYSANGINDVAWYHYLCSIFGSILTSVTFIIFITTFILHYYDTEKNKALDKWLYRTMIACIPLFIVFLFIMSEGYAHYLNYPLINGIYFGSEGVHWASPSGQYSPTIAFYAIAILSGALFVYFLCDHKMYKQYGKHGLVESTFLVAFPSGIIGARLFYVIGNWELEFAGRDWTKVFAIHDGGLTILGGAIVGIVVGVLWFMWRNKGYSIWVAVDVIVPTILLAQAIGRWGNFFNCEVHGVAVSDSYWRFLPTIILENLRYSSAHPGVVLDGQIYVPLFLIESIVNICGYFVLSYLFGKVLRKYTDFGDLAFGYVIWYGLTRTFMEPLRDGAYNMGVDGYWSWIWSIVFIGAGFLLVMINHIVRYYLAKRKREKEGTLIQPSSIKSISIGLSVFAALTIICLATGGALMDLNEHPLELVFNAYNIGLIVLVFGISFFFISAIFVPHLIDSIKFNKKQVNE